MLFKDWVKTQRPVLDIDAVATGETWFGPDALERKLVDELITSDDVLLQKVSVCPCVCDFTVCLCVCGCTVYRVCLQRKLVDKLITSDDVLLQKVCLSVCLFGVCVWVEYVFFLASSTLGMLSCFRRWLCGCVFESVSVWCVSLWTSPSFWMMSCFRRYLCICMSVCVWCIVCVSLYAPCCMCLYRKLVDELITSDDVLLQKVCVCVCDVVCV